MVPRNNIWVLVGGCLLLAGVVRAESAKPGDGENQFQVIVERNPFNLKPPAPPPPPPPPEERAPSNVKISGITTLFDKKRVMLVTIDPGKQPEYHMLTEGEKSGPLEVVEIHEKQGTVRIRNAGMTRTLSFDTDGIKSVALPVPPPGVSPAAAAAAAAAMSGGVPGAPSVPQPPKILPSINPSPAAPSGQSPMRTIPTRPTRTPTSSLQPELPSNDGKLPDFRFVQNDAPKTIGPPEPTVKLTVEESVILKAIDQEVNAVKSARGDYPPPLPILAD